MLIFQTSDARGTCGLTSASKMWDFLIVCDLHVITAPVGWLWINESEWMNTIATQVECKKNTLNCWKRRELGVCVCAAGVPSTCRSSAKNTPINWRCRWRKAKASWCCWWRSPRLRPSPSQTCPSTCWTTRTRGTRSSRDTWVGHVLPH